MGEIFFLFCRKKALTILSVSLFMLTCNTNEIIEQDFKQVNTEFKKNISNAKATEMFINDQETRLEVLGKQNLSFKNRTSYFELSILKEYLYNIERKAVKHNIEISRINFVFGADTNLKRTVFLVPMYYDTLFKI